MSPLHKAVRDYLELRRNLGFKLLDPGRLLPQFVEFLEQRGSTHITTALALEWAQLPTSVQPAEWTRRLGTVRCFARHRQASDPRTEVPPHGLLPHRSTRARPYLYSDDEVERLLAAALKLPTNRRRTVLYPWKFHCLIGLLSTTGMRMSEALNLRVSDIDLDQALLTIRGAKFGQVRLLPLHATTKDVLADYLRRRTAYFGSAASQHVFVTSRGNQLDQANVHRTFYKLSRSVGIRGEQASFGPRLHDFRHRFAVKVLLAWYQSGQDSARLLPVLQTYLGHVRLEDTYWYLNAWPELMAHAMSRLEQRWEAAS